MELNIMKATGTRGFTLVELMLALVISSIIMMAIYATYNSQQKTFVVEDQVVAMQQNLRAGMINLQRETKMIGCNPTGGVITPSSGGNPAIYVASATVFSFRMNTAGGESDGNDNDGDGLNDEYIRGSDDSLQENYLSTNPSQDNPLEWFDWDTTDANEDVSYYLYDADLDGNVDELGREDVNDGTGIPTPVAENIEALGFAYAFDNDGDGELDTTASDTIIWAVDSDNGGDLDVNLDTNNDGTIDINDNVLGAGISAVDFDQIRAVRIWILARSDREDREYFNNNIYVVSNQRITPSAQGNDGEDNDGDGATDESDEQNKGYCRMRLLMTTVRCLNMGI